MIDQLQLERLLREAQRRHDHDRRRHRDGVSAQDLAADNGLWNQVGRDIAGLARRIRQSCLTSHFGDARPEVTLLVDRLVESVDDQVDNAAWRVIQAAARLACAPAGSTPKS